MQITSTQNPLIKQVLQLQEKSRARKKSGLFIIEGIREIQLALKGAYTVNTLLYCESVANTSAVAKLLKQTTTSNVVTISETVYKKIAYRTSTEGVIAIANSKNHNLSELTFKHKNPLVLVAEAPEKPGNIGALLRTADAANLDAVIIANPKTDLYNPNIVRSSVGCLFTNTIATGTTTEVINFLKQQNIPIYCTALTASAPYYTQNFKDAAAIVVGTEATGLSEDWLKNASQNIIIPMQGEIDSMNVSVAAAIVIFEAKRQRNFK